MAEFTPQVRGLHKDTHERFTRWRDKRIWEKLLDQLVTDIVYERLVTDAGHVKVHPHAAGARGGNQDMQRTKRGFNTKLHLAVDAHGMPIRVLFTSGTVADCTQAGQLIQGM